MHVWFVPPSRFAFLSARKSCTCQLTPNVVWSCLDTIRFYCFFLLFPHENVCQPSFLQSKLRSITARLSHLQTVIDGQKKSTSLGHNVEIPDRTRAFAHDGRDPRSWRQTKPCRGQHVLAKSYTANQHAAWIGCARCVLRPHNVPRHTARMTSVSTPSSASVQEALKRMSLQRDNDFTPKAVRDMIAEVEGSLERRRLHHNQRTCATPCTILERHPVRRSARELQCKEKSRRHHHPGSARQLVVGASLS